MRLRENFNIAKKCVGDCRVILPGNPQNGTSDIEARVIAVPLDGLR